MDTIEGYDELLIDGEERLYELFEELTSEDARALGMNADDVAELIWTHVLNKGLDS